MSRRVRLTLFVLAAAVLAAVLVHGLAGLPRFGDFHGVDGLAYNRLTVPERRATDVITAINFDYRGVDTMGEEFILFAASLGLVVLLREQHDERTQEVAETDPSTEVAHPLPGIVGRALLPPLIVLGVDVVTHGQLTPGGGFQGGVILASGVIVLFVAGGALGMRPIPRHPVMEVMEALGAGGYVAIGLAGLIAGLRFLSNFLPFGHTGALLSSGTIASLSVIVGLEVAGGIALVAAEFAEQGRREDRG